MTQTLPSSMWKSQSSSMPLQLSPPPPVQPPQTPAVQVAVPPQAPVQGMVMAATSFLKENPNPTEAEVREGLEGNLCRCTGYHNIVKAVMSAAGGA